MLIRNAKFGVSGVLVGAFALLLSMLTFWAGPLSSSSPAHSTQERVISWKQTVRRVLFDEPSKQALEKNTWDIDRVIFMAIPTLSAIAILLSVFSFIHKEPWRLIVSAATVAVAAVTFQFMATYMIILLIAIAVLIILSVFFAA